MIPALTVNNYTGTVKSVLKAQLSGIAIETNDSGPWDADVWWLLLAGTRSPLPSRKALQAKQRRSTS